jgi:hypothetical protein
MSPAEIGSLMRRSGGRCERGGERLFAEEDLYDDGRGWPGRGGRWSVQHRRPAGMGGTNSPTFNAPWNVLLVCGSGTTGCHGWIETHRTLSQEAGWLVSQYADPATAIVMALGRPVLLTPDWAYLDPHAEDVARVADVLRAGGMP